MKNALLLVDVQNDFTPGGALGVPGGDEIVPIIDDYIDLAQAARMIIIASRDWHPPETKHFRQWGGTWPPHCVQGTRGAEFRPDLRLPKDAWVVSKGMDPNEDAYSVFQATAPDGAPFKDLLQRLWVGRLFIGGLATDYCVLNSVIDAAAIGVQTTVLADAVRGINLAPGDIERAIAQMVAAGASLTVLNRFSHCLHTP
ncbi:MAG: nicotinamidase [Chloroflexi bacterium]|nr:nicotinamidase [Chloroflexota bacterium]MCL5108322.1 nicotinamidase [Chloroflexota bacterium]MDA8218260.1 nicotinamidase [Dehalococcoidales bacterium]